MDIAKIQLPEFKGIEQHKAEQIRRTFEPMSNMLYEFEKDYNELIEDACEGITQNVTIRAKRLRIDIAQVRIETRKLKDKQKE